MCGKSCFVLCRFCLGVVSSGPISENQDMSVRLLPCSLLLLQQTIDIFKFSGYLRQYILQVNYQSSFLLCVTHTLTFFVCFFFCLLMTQNSSFILFLSFMRHIERKKPTNSFPYQRTIIQYHIGVGGVWNEQVDKSESSIESKERPTGLTG